MTPTLTTEDSAVVTVKVTGEVAEIEKYRFDYKLDSATTWQTASTRVSNYRTYGYTYNDLEEGKEYNLRVTATDAEGEIYSSEVQTVTATYNGWYEVINLEDTTLTEKTVDYIPDRKAITTSEFDGLTMFNGSIDTKLDLGWFIWGKDDNYLYLIGNSMIGQFNGNGLDCTIRLPWCLDKVSLTCYNSKNFSGNLVRSLKIEDIWSKTPTGGYFDPLAKGKYIYVRE